MLPNLRDSTVRVSEDVSDQNLKFPHQCTIVGCPVKPEAQTHRRDSVGMFVIGVRLKRLKFGWRDVISPGVETPSRAMSKALLFILWKAGQDSQGGVSGCWALC